MDDTCECLPPFACCIYQKRKAIQEIIDVSPKTYALNEEKVLQKLVEKNKKYAGVLFVRNYGEEKDNSSFLES